MAILKNKIFIFIVIVAVIFIAVIWYAYQNSPTFKESTTFWESAKVIDEKIVIPKTEVVDTIDARIGGTGGQSIALVPKTKGEEVVVPNAELTLRNALTLALVAGKTWASDAKPVYIKSLGVVTLEGKSSTWQVMSGSRTKKVGYEVIVQGPQILSEREVFSSDFGGILPESWKDLDVIIKELQSHPLYKDATISGVSFYYDNKTKTWYYGIQTSKGMSSIKIE